jgi:predicted secreted protein
MSETTSMHLKVGEREVLRLPGRGTAGYSWVCDLPGDPNTVKVSIGMAPVNDPRTIPPGTSADELAEIEGIRPGTATVHLSQRRSWEKAGRVLDERTIEITVSD